MEDMAAPLAEDMVVPLVEDMVDPLVEGMVDHHPMADLDSLVALPLKVLPLEQIHSECE
jgi:hypothetical protein